MMVWLVPSVTVLVTCFTPDTLATASSTFFVTWASSSEGAAPASVTVTATTGMSTLGARVMGSIRNATSPSSVSTVNSTSGGIGMPDRRARDVPRHAATPLPPRPSPGRRPG